MYALLGIDAVLRITAALLVLFVAVPALARRRPPELDRMQWFWWCFAAGTMLLTIGGQILTLLNVLNTFTLLLLLATLVLVVRARTSGRRVAAILHDLYRAVVFFSLNVLEGRVNVRRRFRRAVRRTRAAAAPVLRASRWTIAAWTAIVGCAAITRLYRPFATANLGYSDTYVHLYLVRLLEQGRQVDPAWGPYPRGMHFLLYSIHELTSVDAILLMNFFGPIAGVLMTLAVADTARRLAGKLAAGVVAGVLFATMIGGGSQYFLFGGSMASDQVDEAAAFVRLAYRDIPPTNAEFDVLLSVFQRQTATLPQELAIVFLFPAVMFLWSAGRARFLGAPRVPRGSSGETDSASHEELSSIRHPERSEGPGGEVREARVSEPLPPRPLADARDDRWLLSGYLFCTAAIAAIHPGVAVPLVLLSGVTVLVTRRHLWAAIVTGAAGILLGSTWMLGYIAYPHIGTKDIESAQGVSSATLYYFPFLRSGELSRIVTWVAITPFLIGCIALALVLLLRRKPALVWTALATFTFLLTHVASRYRLPEFVEVRRNASWLVMMIAILIGVAAVEFARVRIARAAVAAGLVLWLVTVPLSGAQQKLLNYSGYSATAYAVLQIQRKHEPFTWTLVTYGQEFPMVLGKGFHLSAADFLDRYDPAEPKLDIPTRYVFIAVEKNPHPFQINSWARQFSRADVERRLETWCFLYQRSHRDMRVFLEDENVRVYVIEGGVP